MSAENLAPGAGPLPRSNSYQFVPVLDLERGPGVPCPLRGERGPELVRALERLGPLAPERSLLIRLRDRMRLCRTTTRDFSDAELREIKERLGQIYADVSSKIAPDDFSRDLVKLELQGECTRCERRGSCGGCWAAHGSDVFSRDDARVRQIVGRLSGDVLDVGCGEAPYALELEAGACAGKVRYWGVDPDGRRVRLLASRHPWGNYRAQTLEGFRSITDRPEGFDHVLILRSYNHFPDPERALDAALALLRPGGTLLVVDNVAFGLVRGSEHAAAAERGLAGFEHYRNDPSDRAAELLLARGVRVLERRDVGPTTSNQWLVHVEKMSEA